MNNKPKVSILAMSLGSGGAEKVISLLIPELAKEYHVTLVLFFNAFHFAVPEEIEVHLISEKKHLNVFEKIFLFPYAIYRYFQIIKRKNIRTSISFLIRPNFVNGAIKFLLGSRIKVIMSERNYPSLEYKSSFVRYYMYKLLIPLFYNKADLVFSNSQWINKDLTENFNVRSDLDVIYNPVVIPQRCRQSEKSFKGQINFINVGRMIPVKNQQLIIDSFTKVRYDYGMKFAGDGILRNQLESNAGSALLSDKIHFLGNVKNVNDFLLDAHCFILSSNSEGFPNALIEAMSMGVAVISTNCLSGPLEILNDNEPITIPRGEFVMAKYGILINTNDSLALTKAIEYLITNPAVLENLTFKSIERASRFAVDKIYLEFSKHLCH